jgi:leucyl/phenylalanyl-tRNA--protein transferase
MVLEVSKFKLHRSLKKTIAQFRDSPHCEIRIDSAFTQVISACSTSPRQGQKGSWIVPEMITAYTALHDAGFAHSVETWIDGELVGGLYCVAVGRAVFGESMFSRSSNASKIALAALVSFCKKNSIIQIDCQQNTAHLSTLGAGVIPRKIFIANLALSVKFAAPGWKFGSHDWQYLLDCPDYQHEKPQ